MLLVAGPLVKREALKSLEANFRDDLRSREMEIFASPTGFYVDGVGVVFTSEVSLTYAPMPNPFEQVIPAEKRARIHDKEVKQLPLLREDMRQLLLRSATALDALPVNEQVIVGVKVSHQLWEDKSGIPEQIVMQATKAKLLDARAGKVALDAAIRVQEQ
jgi:hypothetical protein